MQSFPYASAPPLQIHAGETVTASIEMRNIGSSAWDSNTRIATTVPRDHADPFVGPDWLSPDRLASVPAGMTIPPGGTYRFQWTWSVPVTTAPGLYDEHYGMVEEGVAWFSDPGQAGPADENIEGIIEVLPALPMPDAGLQDASANDVATDVHGDARGDAHGDAHGDGGPVMNVGGCGCAVPAGGRSRLHYAGLIALAAMATRRRRGVQLTR